MKKSKKLDSYRHIESELLKFAFLCSMSQNNLKKIIRDHLVYEKFEPINENGFLYAKGELPILLVAHLDTVHNIPVKFDLDEYQNVISSPTGIGGDDRCGIYIILELIKSFRCSVLFCEDEEIGGIGASLFAQSDIIETIDINYILEFDRRGFHDAVFYSCANTEFEKFITEELLFKKEYGSFSDICIVAPATGVSAVNLSAGYYHEHSVDEYVNISHMNDIIGRATKIINKPSPKFEFICDEYIYDEFELYSNGRDLYMIIYELDGIETYYEVVAFSEIDAISSLMNEEYGICQKNIIDVIYMGYW